jgi:hypothetical protein
MIRITARQQGGAVIITIPADILKLKHIKAGDALNIEVTPDGFAVRKAAMPEIRMVTPGPVKCDPLGIRFPCLYRATSVATLEDLQRHGLDRCPDLSPGTYTEYSLKEETFQIGTTTFEKVTHIFPGDQSESLVIRHHPSLGEASGYLEATMDMTLWKGEEDDTLGGVLHQTEDGFFTLAMVPTNPAWPGPLVIYLAQVPAPNPSGMDYWAYAVGPDGEVVELPEFKIPNA